jgi:uncharacterized protein (DUF2249 family)
MTATVSRQQDVAHPGPEDPAGRALALLAERGDELLAALSVKIELATAVTLPRADRQRGRERLVGFCTGRVLAYIRTRDRVIYSLAAEATESRLLVRALRAQQQLVVAHVAELRRAVEPTEVTSAAYAMRAVLTACGEVERTVLWPWLARLPGLNLPGAVAEFDAVLRHSTPTELDVRRIQHGKRHFRVLDACARLTEGESLVFVDNHDPVLLQLAVKASYPGQFEWTSVEAGPDRWRVRIARAPAASVQRAPGLECAPSGEF